MPGYAQTVELTSSRLRELYRAALHNRTGAIKVREFGHGGVSRPASNRRCISQVLHEPEFQALEAGIVLQAYLPDSYSVTTRIDGMGAARQSRGGAGIKIRW